MAVAVHVPAGGGLARAESGRNRLDRDPADLHRRRGVRTHPGHEAPEVREGLQGHERILHRGTLQGLRQYVQQDEERFGKGTAAARIFHHLVEEHAADVSDRKPQVLVEPGRAPVEAFVPQTHQPKAS
ncbi:hypothetical protein [Streptomyces erythrochromogenes]|uniref:hypothetical protein n=1 Tax=Streptomyces erythrochromogenes TaxID=285574 RepID=UPI0036FBEECD